MTTTTQILESRERFLVSGHERMGTLVAAFPTLRSAPGAGKRWDFKIAQQFARWASGREMYVAQSAAFVLSVWNGSTPPDGGWWNQGEFDVGRFDAVEAFAYWDQIHQQAFLAWCVEPFWP